MHRWLKRTGLALASAVAATATLVPASTAHAEIGYDLGRWCGNSADVIQIQVMEWPDGRFKIMLTPTYESRFSFDYDATTVSMWHAIQGCVPGLYDELADSIWDQLYCHQRGALVKNSVEDYATGDTYDLESWRKPGAAVQNRCGNALDTDQDPSGEGQLFRPDGRDRPGYTDLLPPDNIG